MPQNAFIFPILYSMLYLTGVLLAITAWRRSPLACGLLLAGSMLNLLMTLLRVGAQHLILVEQRNFELYQSVMLGLGLVQWVAHGLILFAVLAGRSDAGLYREPALPEDDWERPTSNRTGIQERKP